MHYPRRQLQTAVGPLTLALAATLALPQALASTDGRTAFSTRTAPPSTQLVEAAPVTAAYRPKPGLRIVQGGVAVCEAGSDSVGNAYRCFARHYVYDPCWTDSASQLPAVLCQFAPWDTRVTRLVLQQHGLGPFFDRPIPFGQGEPWGVQLSTGVLCVAEQGAHDTFKGRVVDYSCGRNEVLLRGMNRSGRLWTFASATYRQTPTTFTYFAGPIVQVKTAWYAMQDTASAQGAHANVCGVGALAYAALAYENTHHDPDGALPVIISHACAGAYAIVLFEQDAPPPGYKAEIAFKRSPSGWRAIGRTRSIARGMPGIPAATEKKIQAAISRAPHRESVPF